jgi:ERF superfamily
MTDSIHKAMSKAFAAIEGATKDTNNPFFKTKYADLSSVVAAIKPALIANELWFRQVNHERDGGVCVETIVGHSSGGEISFGTLFVPASKNDAQAYGSALTYARRYALQTAFGVCPDDDDGNAATVHSKAKEESQKERFRITDEQRDELATLIDSYGFNIAEVCQAMKIKTLKEIWEDQFGPAKDFINNFKKAG